MEIDSFIQTQDALETVSRLSVLTHGVITKFSACWRSRTVDLRYAETRLNRTHQASRSTLVSNDAWLVLDLMRIPDLRPCRQMNWFLTGRRSAMVHIDADQLQVLVSRICQTVISVEMCRSRWKISMNRRASTI